jgi:hypothetical protein
MALPAGFTDASWDGSASRFTPEQWRSSCLIDTGEGDPDSKARYKLPVREPGGAINANAVSAATSALVGGRGGVDAPSSAKAAAARKLRGFYSRLGRPVPDSLANM